MVAAVIVSACACAKEPGSQDSGDSGEVVGNTTVKISADKTSVLKNPLTGWVMYVSGTADPSYFDTKVTVPDLGK